MDSGTLERLVAALRTASRLTVLTGAGISAASGVPTFRGPGGLWKNYRPEQLATADAFTRDPRLVWEWYDWRRQIIAGCSPNRGHEVLANWSRRFPVFTLITQNVDGLHERARTLNVIRFHGSIWAVSCWNRCSHAPRSWRDETVPFPLLPPPCPYCGGHLRPAVIWFGEAIDADVMRRSQDATACDVFLTIGTSAVVYPAVGLAQAARHSGAFTAEINLEETPVTGVLDLSLLGPAEDVLDALSRRLVGEITGSRPNQL